MAKIGYARVSTKGQNDDSQVDELTAYGVDKLFVDHGISGKHASALNSTPRSPTSAKVTCSSSPACRAPCGRSST